MQTSVLRNGLQLGCNLSIECKVRCATVTAFIILLLSITYFTCPQQTKILYWFIDLSNFFLHHNSALFELTNRSFILFYLSKVKVLPRNRSSLIAPSRAITADSQGLLQIEIKRKGDREGKLGKWKQKHCNCNVSIGFRQQRICNGLVIFRKVRRNVVYFRCTTGLKRNPTCSPGN